MLAMDAVLFVMRIQFEWNPFRDRMNASLSDGFFEADFSNIAPRTKKIEVSFDVHARRGHA
jgi:hypothetical protein